MVRSNSACMANVFSTTDAGIIQHHIHAGRIKSCSTCVMMKSSGEISLGIKINAKYQSQCHEVVCQITVSHTEEEHWSSSCLLRIIWYLQESFDP